MVKGIAPILIGRLVQVMMSLISLKLLVYILSQNELSIYYLIMSACSLFGLVLSGPIGIYFNRHYLDNISTLKKESLFFSKFVALTFFSSVLVLGLSVVYFWQTQIHLYWLIALVIFFDFLFNSILRTLLNILNLQEKQVKFVFFNNFQLALSLVFIIVASKMYEISYMGWFICLMTSKFIVAVVIYAKELNIVTRITSPNFKVVYKFSLPLVFSSLFMWGHSQSYRFILEANGALIVIATVALLQTFAAQIVSNIQSVFIQVINPKFFSLVSQKKDYMKFWLKSFYVSLLLYVTVFIVLAKFGDVFIELFLSDKYVAYLSVLLILLSSEIFKCLSNQVNLLHQAIEITQKTMISNFFGLLPLPLLFFIELTPINVAMIICGGTLSVFIVNLIITYSQIKSIKFILVSVFSLLGLSMLTFYFYKCAE